MGWTRVCEHRTSENRLKLPRGLWIHVLSLLDLPYLLLSQMAIEVRGNRESTRIKWTPFTGNYTELGGCSMPFQLQLAFGIIVKSKYVATFRETRVRR